MLQNSDLKRRLSLPFVGLLFSVALVAAAFFPRPAEGQAERSGGERKGDLHITKNCGTEPYAGNAGDYCTIETSNLAEIPSGSTIYYTQAIVVSSTPESGAISFDSNVVLFVGFGDWAIGRCTLDSRTYPGNYGLCTFSDGVGPLAGFTARVNVTPFENTSTNANYHWDGTYKFRPQSHD